MTESGIGLSFSKFTSSAFKMKVFYATLNVLFYLFRQKWQCIQFLFLINNFIPFNVYFRSPVRPIYSSTKRRSIPDHPSYWIYFWHITIIQGHNVSVTWLQLLNPSCYKKESYIKKTEYRWKYPHQFRLIMKEVSPESKLQLPLESCQVSNVNKEPSI